MKTMAIAISLIALAGLSSVSLAAGAKELQLGHQYLECAAYFKLAGSIMEDNQEAHHAYRAAESNSMKRGRKLLSGEKISPNAIRSAFDAYLLTTARAIKSDTVGAARQFEVMCDGPMKAQFSNP
jgi:hypothetical protein